MSTGDVVGEPEAEPAAEALGDAANVLVLSSTMDSTARGAYFERLLPDTASLSVLAVTYGKSAERWLDDWRAHVGEPPENCAIVSVDDVPRSVAASTPAGESGPTPGVSGPQIVDSVDSPDDLTGLGITLGEFFEEWADGDDMLVTFDSLTVLLQYVELQRAFRFLHVMSNRVRAAGAVGHYHLDPGAHEPRTVATLSSLFDAVVELEGDQWTVRGRR